MRIVIADDNLLVREGVTAMLTRAGFEVVSYAESADELLREVEAHRPDAAIVDIRMPPTQTDEGLVAAREIRARFPETAIVILSQHLETGVGTRILVDCPGRLAYVLKDRVLDAGEFAALVRRVVAGGSALDPQVVSRLLASNSHDGPLCSLTAREHDVLALVAEGRSNKGIADRLDITERAVRKHVTAVFGKLGLPADEDDNRRILAVLAYLWPDGPAVGTP